MNVYNILNKNDVFNFIKVQSSKKYDEITLLNKSTKQFKQLEYSLKISGFKSEEDKILVYTKCPISNKELTLPARSVNCDHYECINLIDYLFNYIKRKYYELI